MVLFVINTISLVLSSALFCVLYAADLIPRNPCRQAWLLLAIYIVPPFLLGLHSTFDMAINRAKISSSPIPAASESTLEWLDFSTEVPWNHALDDVSRSKVSSA